MPHSCPYEVRAMSQSTPAELETPVIVDPSEHDPVAGKFPETLEGRLLFWIAVAFSIYQVVTAAHLIDMNSQVQRGFHLGFLTLLGMPLIAVLHRHAPPLKVLAWILGL